MSNEWKNIEDAIDTVKNMLLKKKDIWTSGQSPFHQFDAMQDMHVTPEQFGLIMANLKMNRVKTIFDKHTLSSNPNDCFILDPDAEDSLIDLASYAILTLGLLYRARDQVEDVSEEKSEAERFEEFKAETDRMNQEKQREAMRKMMEDGQRQQQTQINQQFPPGTIDPRTQVWFGDPPYPSYSFPPRPHFPQDTTLLSGGLYANTD